MAGFDYSDEQEEMRVSVRRFAESEIKPHAAEWDEAQHFPRELFPKMAALGLTGALFPETCGGAGLGPVEQALITEEIARCDPGVALSLAAHVGLSANHIYRAGNESQRQRFVAPLAGGEKLGAWAMTEAASGSDAAAMSTTATFDSGQWVLRGAKNLITHGASADVVVILAVTDPSQGKKGISAFVVERGTPGLSSGKKENKLGMRSSETASVIMEDCALPAENLLGELNRGYIEALDILDGGRISLGALAVGLAQGAFEAALEYARERKAFGQSISTFQAIRCKLADMAIQIDAARLLTLRAARMRAAGLRVTQEAAMAKVYASEMAVRVSEEAIQIFGGYGYMKDYPVEKLWRDSKVLTIGEGTSEIQRLIIAREVLRAT